MASQDWCEKDFYAILGVPKDADQAAIGLTVARREDLEERAAALAPFGTVQRLDPDACRKRQIKAGIAIRALDDTRMIRRSQPGGPPTVSRQIRDDTVVGVILAPAHVEGLDPKAFAPAAEGEVDASSGSAATPHRGF